VIVPALTFVATANAVVYCGARPVLIDVDRETGCLDANKVRAFIEHNCFFRGGLVINKRTRKKVRALLPVHVLGHPADMDALTKIARQYNLTVIEDACEALGAEYKGRKAGLLGDIACFSFNGNKIVTAGGGGMIVTRRQSWARRARYLSTQARDHLEEYIHGEIGFNYRMTNLQAAVGCAQMERLPQFLKKKMKIALGYENAFSNVPGIHVMASATWAKPTHWLFTIRLHSVRALSARLVHFLASKGIESRRLWRPLHWLPMYRREKTSHLKMAEDFYKEAVSLPSSLGLSKAEQDKVIQHVLEFARTAL
jgi:perosamine synthetase